MRKRTSLALWRIRCLPPSLGFVCIYIWVELSRREGDLEFGKRSGRCIALHARREGDLIKEIFK